MLKLFTFLTPEADSDPPNTKSFEMTTAKCLERTHANLSAGISGITTTMGLSIWVNWHTATDSDAGLVSRYANPNRNWAFFMSGSKMSMYYWNTSGDDAFFQTSSAPSISTNTWYHFLYNVDVTEATATDRCKMWLDGASQTVSMTVNNAAQSVAIRDMDAPLWMGAVDVDDGGNNTTAYFDDVVLLDRIFTAGEITDLSGGKYWDPATSGTLGYWRFEDDLTDDTSDGQDLSMRRGSATYNTSVPYV